MRPMEQQDYDVRGKYTCTACKTVDLRIGVNVEFDSRKGVLRHMHCGGEVVLDEKRTKSDFKHFS